MIRGRMMQRRGCRPLAVSAVLLGATVTLAACAPFGAATPTVAPQVTATLPASATPSATVAPTSTVTAPTAPAATATVAAPTPTVMATVAPTSTVPPPTATAPAPTATVPATATRAPTATLPPPTTAIPPTLVAVSPPPLAGVSATDARGRCAITLPAGFAATGGGAFTGANGQASITLTALDNGAGDTLDDVALPYVSTFTAAIGDYQQTAVARGTDDLRLDFTGRMTASGRGTMYLRQFGESVCALSFFIVQGGEVSYEPTVSSLLASLRPAGAIGDMETRERIV